MVTLEYERFHVMGGGTQDKKLSKGDLLRVVYHHVYHVYEDKHPPLGAGGGVRGGGDKAAESGAGRPAPLSASLSIPHLTSSAVEDLREVGISKSMKRLETF